MDEQTVIMVSKEKNDDRVKSIIFLTFSFKFYKKLVVFFFSVIQIKFELLSQMKLIVNYFFKNVSNLGSN